MKKNKLMPVTSYQTIIEAHRKAISEAMTVEEMRQCLLDFLDLFSEHMHDITETTEYGRRAVTSTEKPS